MTEPKETAMERNGMTVKVVWTETWRREKVVTLDEADVREYLDQPDGPISDDDLRQYLDEESANGLDSWLHEAGNLDPRDADLDYLNVEEAQPVAAVSS